MKSFFIILLLIFTSQAIAEKPLVDGNVDDVKTFGYWEENGKNGIFRLVITSSGFEHIHNQVYAQWLEENEEKRIVLKSTWIAELDMLHSPVVEIEEIQVESKSTVVHLALTNPYSLESSLASLHLFNEPPIYKFVLGAKSGSEGH